MIGISLRSPLAMHTHALSLAPSSRVEFDGRLIRIGRAGLPSFVSTWKDSNAIPAWYEKGLRSKKSFSSKTHSIVIFFAVAIISFRLISLRALFKALVGKARWWGVACTAAAAAPLYSRGRFGAHFLRIEFSPSPSLRSFSLFELRN